MIEHRDVHVLDGSFPFAALILAHDASDAHHTRDAHDVVEGLVSQMVATAVQLGATPVIVALPSGVAAPAGARIVRTKVGGSTIAAIRFGMAQLANTRARAVLLWPRDGVHPSMASLVALVDAAARDANAIVAIDALPLDRSPVVIPRDAWLELVTLGESGLDAVAARRGEVRVRSTSE